MSKASVLQAALTDNAGKNRPPAPAVQKAEAAALKTQRVTPAPARAPSRADKVNVSGWFNPAYKRSMRMVQAITDKKLEALLAEAMNDLFAKYNVPQVRADE